jgi:hypothetical protein
MVSLWVRIGNGGDYVAHGDDLKGAIQQMKDEGVGRLVSWVRGGFEATTHRRGNYISLYYGNQDMSFSHNLDNKECKLVERALGVEE